MGFRCGFHDSRGSRGESQSLGGFQLTKVICLLIGAMAVFVAAEGCGGSNEQAESGVARLDPPPRVSVTLDDHAGAENVGIVMAQQRGFFGEAGFDFWAGDPISPAYPIGYVTREIDNFGVTQLPQFILAKERGEALVAVGSLLPQSTAAMIWLPKSGIGGVADLAGKTVAVPGVPFQEGLLQSVLKQAGVRPGAVEIRRVGYDLVPALLDGKADAIFGGSWNVEGAELESRGMKPVVKRVRAFGVPRYDELVIFSRASYVAKQPQVVRRFLAAVLHGTQATLEDPKAAAEVLIRHKDRNRGTSLEAVEDQLEATLPLLSRTGYVNPRQATHLADWMYDERLIRRRWAAEDLLTNRYLPAPAEGAGAESDEQAAE
jgi:ABC-type nitrate/sulfonate/bicarbonate transport system substrate-binding protein